MFTYCHLDLDKHAIMPFVKCRPFCSDLDARTNIAKQTLPKKYWRSWKSSVVCLHRNFVEYDSMESSYFMLYIPWYAFIGVGGLALNSSKECSYFITPLNRRRSFKSYLIMRYLVTVTDIFRVNFYIGLLRQMNCHMLVIMIVTLMID